MSLLRGSTVKPSLADEAILKEHGYIVGRWGKHGWTLEDPEGRALMIAGYGCMSPTRWQAVAEGLKRISWEDDGALPIPPCDGGQIP